MAPAQIRPMARQQIHRREAIGKLSSAAVTESGAARCAIASSGHAGGTRLARAEIWSMARQQNWRRTVVSDACESRWTDVSIRCASEKRLGRAQARRVA